MARIGAIAIRLNPKASKHVLDELKALLSRTADLKPLNQQLAKYMVTDTRRRISFTKIAPDGTHWEPLSRATEEIRARIGAMSDHHSDLVGLAGNILVDQHRLLKSIRAGYVGPSEFEVRTDDPNAAFMQYGVAETGGWIEGKRIPARPFLGFSDANKRTIRRKILAYLEKGST